MEAAFIIAMLALLIFVLVAYVEELRHATEYEEFDYDVIYEEPDWPTDSSSPHG